MEENVRGAIPGPRRQAGGGAMELPKAGILSQHWGQPHCQRFGEIDMIEVPRRPTCVVTGLPDTSDFRKVSPRNAAD